jgi:2-polyprenyl-3-methyl-5-hydroxy-6-metoxy-1,4-benzoquinol methylase
MNSARFSYKDLPFEQVPCPLCGGTTFQTLSREDRYGMGLVTVGCDGCGFIFTNPRPTSAALNDFYTHHYRREYRKLDAPDAEYVRKHGLDRRAVYTTNSIIERKLVGPGSRILDVGCAEGSLLRELGARLPDARRVGVEPTIDFGGFCRTYASCEVQPSVEAVAASKSGPFDCIIAIHVVEHVDDPVRFLKQLAGLLAEGGALYIDVPDTEAYASLHDLHLAHLLHFTRRTLFQTVARAGLHVASLDGHSPPKHPISLRCVIRRTPPSPSVAEPADAREAAYERVRRVGRRTLAFTLRQTLPGKVVAACWRGLKRVAGR